jgi:regulatory protein
LFQYGVSLLGRRALSAGEIRTKLARKAVNADDVERSMSRLREYGFVDDSKFAEGFATARKEVFGAARVMRDLRQRRVSAPVAEKAVEAAYENVDETEAVTAWLQRKLRGKNIAEFLSEEKNLASVYRKLRYAGFRSGPAIVVLKRYANKADDLEDAAD